GQRQGVGFSGAVHPVVGVPERPIAVAPQHVDVGGAIKEVCLRHHEVQLAVAVHVAGGDGGGPRDPDRRLDGIHQRAVAPAEQDVDADTGGIVGAGREVELAVSVEVAYRQSVLEGWRVGGGRVAGRLERAVAVAQEYTDAAVAVRRGQVRDA